MFKAIKIISKNIRSFSSFEIKEGITPGRPAYLDFQATTPLDPRVLDDMLPFMVSEFGNPHSRTHPYGWKAADAVEKARSEVADIIGADPKEIVFTSGATESNNTAIKGIAKFYAQKGKNKIVTIQTEHKCVLDTCRHLQEEGFQVVYLPVETNGLVNLSSLEEAIDDKTSLVTIMAANNEIGVIQPIKQIGEICRKKGAFFHSDCAQAVGKIPVNVNEMNIDLASISGHKIYGPKGIGALYVRRKPRVRIEPLINGGGQERGMRSGTLAPALVVGIGSACRIAKEELPREAVYVGNLAKKFKEEVMKSVKNVILNGDPVHRLPGNLNMSFAYVEGESLIMGLKHLALSSGSACTSASLEPSYVLRAIGVQEDLAHTSLRIGFGRFTTEAEVDYAISLVGKHVEKLRQLSPLWEMVQEGIDLKTIQWTQPH
mmetsp:Transcript_23611/g.23360  ORF Transcript_23611/g.23360 Transcript_23611/m.23360 type:complete len:431 (+) Transcript_23611:3-1295(+)